VVALPGNAENGMGPSVDHERPVKYGRRAAAFPKRVLNRFGDTADRQPTPLGKPWDEKPPGTRFRGPGTDRTASEFPAKGAGNPWQSCQSPEGTVPGGTVFRPSPGFATYPGPPPKNG
jgi:hypothetical protein